jgi:hypothetical protein
LEKVLYKILKKAYRDEGRAEAKLEDARRMLLRGMEVDFISDITELPEEKIRQLQK